MQMMEPRHWRGVELKVYHTDAEGAYNKKGDRREVMRLHVAMITGKDGRYEFRTTKPAPYPGGSSPAHIHASVWGGDYPEQWIDTFLFAGDKFISRNEISAYADAKRFPSMMKPVVEESGVLSFERDIRLRR